MSKKAQVLWEDGIEYIYQPIHFKANIMLEYYVGDVFLGIADKCIFDEGELSELCQVAGMNGFMPELVRELKEDVIGVGNTKYDGYEFGRNTDGGRIDEVNFYFLIRKSDYERIMSKIKFWSIAKSFDHLIYFDVKTVQYAIL
jgi:hypothetical protein